MTDAAIPARDTILRHLAELVAFPTVSSASNLALLDHVEAFAQAHGARCRRFPNPEGDKANLLVSVGPEAPGGLVLSGHTDVVPVEGQAWSGDPFTLRTDGERVIGRGATDMKGFLACCLAALPGLAALPLARPVHLAFSYDEEVGCTGVIDMADWLGREARPMLAVIGEPTLMGLVSAHKGGAIGWTHVKGKPGHSSQPARGVNAVMIAAELVAEASRIAAELRDGPLAPDFDPPYSTLNINIIEGGTAGNILAEDCRFLWDVRMLPGERAEAVLDRLKAKAAALEPGMQALDPAAGIRFAPKAAIPALTPLADTQMEALLLGLLGRDRTEAVSYGTEAGHFAAAGMTTVVIGPGTIADAHQPDESIAISELEACAGFLLRLARRLCADG